MPARKALLSLDTTPQVEDAKAITQAYLNFRKQV